MLPCDISRETRNPRTNVLCVCSRDGTICTPSEGFWCCHGTFLQTTVLIIAGGKRLLLLLSFGCMFCYPLSCCDLQLILKGQTFGRTLGVERKLRVFENMVLRRIFGPRTDEVTGEWRRLHNEELNNLYFSPNIVWVIKSRRMRWAGHVARMGGARGLYRVLVGKPEGKRPLGRPRRRWVVNIRMDLQ